MVRTASVNPVLHLNIFFNFMSTNFNLPHQETKTSTLSQLRVELLDLCAVGWTDIIRNKVLFLQSFPNGYYLDIIESNDDSTKMILFHPQFYQVVSIISASFKLEIASNLHFKN